MRPSQDHPHARAAPRRPWDAPPARAGGRLFEGRPVAPDSTGGPSGKDPPDAPLPLPLPARPVIDSATLLAGGRELVIRHGADRYRLLLTAQNKLILTK